MGAIHVYVSSFFDELLSRPTGLSRFELGATGELVKHGAKALMFSHVRQRFVTLEFERDVQAIARHQDRSWRDEHEAGNNGIIASVARRVNGAAARIAPFTRTMLFSSPARFQPGDTLFVPGIIWWGGGLGEMRRLHHEVGVRIVTYMHDLIPIRRPEFHNNPAGIRRYCRFTDRMLEISDSICASSQFVADDVRRLLRKKGNSHDIPVTRVPLCADITPRAPSRLTPRLAALGLQQDGFALYVSTLNTRKNHAALYAIWRRLIEDRSTPTIPLVIAGQRGWGTADLLKQMSADREVWQKWIIFVEAPTDDEVATLYANCAFTVFPSLYEGWGLGVTESLAFGKPCIASNATAVPEAGQSLATLIDPLDGIGWLREIRRMSTDISYRREVAARIVTDYKPRSWQDVGHDLMQALTAPQASPDRLRESADLS